MTCRNTDSYSKLLSWHNWICCRVARCTGVADPETSGSLGKEFSIPNFRRKLKNASIALSASLGGRLGWRDARSAHVYCNQCSSSTRGGASNTMAHILTLFPNKTVLIC